jgi:ribonuclease Z
MHLLGRTTDLHIYAHEDLKEATEVQLRISHSRLRFKVVWYSLKYDGLHTLFKNKKLTIQSFPLHHGVETCGFKISEKEKQRNIRRECIEKYNIPVPRIRQIKAGADYKLADGTVIPNSELTTDPAHPKSYAFCTDTAYAASTAEYVKGVDLLYHEATFRKKESQRAASTLHSTTLDAARVAAEAGVKKLMLGHYSARYKKDEPFAQEAASIFKNVALAQEGLRIPV